MKDINQIRILVVGDIMLDKYVEGVVNRISPEFPVPIVEVVNEYHTLGGCGNVVRNIAELGAKVDCLASIGNDMSGELIKNELEKVGANPVLINGSKITTVKERIIGDHRKTQMLRVDRECIKKINANSIIELFKHKCKDNYDVIVISDYAKGMITSELMAFLKTNKNHKIIVDPKPENGTFYNGVFMITPNEKEWGQMMFSSAYNLKEVQFILQTKGNKGMTLINNQNDETWDIDAEDVPVYNVSGAGDVVVAMMSVCLSHGLNILDSSYIANKCAGYAVTQPQTCVIPKDKFKQIYKEYFKGNI